MKKRLSGNKKEAILFLTSILTGFSSGLISGITVIAMYRFIDKDYSLANILPLSLGLLSSFSLIVWLILKIKKLKKA